MHQHQQQHSQPPANHASNSLGEANRKYFDSAASANVFKEDWISSLSLQITKGLQSRVGWLGLASAADGKPNPGVKLLDYACGKGLVSMALYTFVDEIRGIDVSAGMVKLYNENAAQLGLESQKMRAIQGDLMEPKGSAIGGEDFRDFDLAVMSMALHHVPDPLAMLRGLVRMLRPGGRVVIIDWTLDSDQDDGTDVVSPQYSSKYPVAYDGFNRQQMARLFKEAGCLVNEYQVHPEPSHCPPMSNPWRHLFFAKGEIA